MPIIAITFRCGHGAEVDPDKTLRPVCAVCGNQHVARAQAPAPTFTGHARGPSAVTRALEPVAVPLATAPLRLKPEVIEHG